MHRLCKMHVLIVGMRSIGVEVAKTVIQSGPRTVTIHDDGLVQCPELSSNVRGYDTHQPFDRYVI